MSSVLRASLYGTTDLGQPHLWTLRFSLLDEAAGLDPDHDSSLLLGLRLASSLTLQASKMAL